MDDIGTVGRVQRTRIREIAPIPAHLPGRIRVCAYVRVSTGHEEQIWPTTWKPCPGSTPRCDGALITAVP